MPQPESFIAIDVQQSCGAALFDERGRLLAFDRLGQAEPDALRAAAAEVLAASESVHWLFSAGQPAAQAVWERAAMRASVRVQRVGHGDWQEALFGAALSPQAAQEKTFALAKQTVSAAGLPAGRLSLAEARAICMGLWAAGQLLVGSGRGPRPSRREARHSFEQGRVAELKPKALQRVA